MVYENSPGTVIGEGLLDLLSARAGIICTVGAGGKKTTLYRLAMLHPGRVGVTSTVHIPPFPKELDAAVIAEDAATLQRAVLEAAQVHRRVAFALPSEKRARLAGVPPAQVREIHARAAFDATFVKADGARARWIKAPDEDEPQIPDGADTVIAVISARAIGRPLSDDIAHHVERIEAITGLRRGDPVKPVHLAQLLASDLGLLKGAGNARIVPVINMVDDAESEAAALAAAAAALGMTGRFDRVVLASMRRADPVVRVVSR